MRRLERQGDQTYLDESPWQLCLPATQDKWLKIARLRIISFSRWKELIAQKYANEACFWRPLGRAGHGRFGPHGHIERDT